jgi:hypothetical protein
MNALKNLTAAVGFAALSLGATSSMAAPAAPLISMGDVPYAVSIDAVDGTNSLSTIYSYTFGAGVTKASFTFDFFDTGSAVTSFGAAASGPAGLTTSAPIGSTAYDIPNDIYTSHYTFNVTGAQLHSGTVNVQVGASYAAAFDSNAHGVNYTLAVTAVPEPESYAMLLAGLGLVGTVIRRRTKSV